MTAFLLLCLFVGGLILGFLGGVVYTVFRLWS